MEVQELTMSSPIGDIHGLGEKALAVFTTGGFATVGQLYNSTPASMRDSLAHAVLHCASWLQSMYSELFPPGDVKHSGHYFAGTGCSYQREAVLKDLLEHMQHFQHDMTA